MSMTYSPYRGYRSPGEVINQAVWLYHGLAQACGRSK
jgi:hypothetical protein